MEVIAGSVEVTAGSMEVMVGLVTVMAGSVEVMAGQGTPAFGPSATNDARGPFPSSRCPGSPGRWW